MPRALKVFRTSTGFHDAYVATPSRAAALRAWGSDNDLFARGMAEEIDDPKLMAEPLAHPGEVIRRSRGSLAEQLAALPEDAPVAKPTRSSEDEAPSDHRPKAKSTPKPAPKPRPSRAKLDRAEEAAGALAADQKVALDTLEAREAALREERHALEAQQAGARDRAERSIATARRAYDAAVDRWRGTS